MFPTAMLLLDKVCVYVGNKNGNISMSLIVYMSEATGGVFQAL